MSYAWYGVDNKYKNVNLANRIIEIHRARLDPKDKFEFYLITEVNDPRQWGVVVNFNNGQAHSEDLHLFPSDLLKTKIMLFS